MTDSRTPGPGDDAPTIDSGIRSAGMTRIGRYTIRRVIASGGMGTVLEAIQDEPRRPVAIKIMKGGIGTPEALRRFQFEAQLLARLRHPAIAQIYEAGTHDDGSGPLPYFAMEYIPNAKSITEYATSRNLGLRERLALFAQVCDAVHHGHQKGIIHRDIKPGNVLVDSNGAPHVIDFGVARAADSDAALPDYQTEIGQLVGSIAYMSPEQFEADPHDLDMRSDVYSLGVVLYELLAGKLPYDILRARIHEAARIVREVEPRRLRFDLPSAPAEVETIVGMALEKDRTRRYQTAFGLADDIRRFLSGQPISAAPPTAAYQLRVFARRHKTLLAGVATLFVVLVAGVAVATSLYVRAERERKQAQREGARAQAAIAFLTTTLEALSPEDFTHEPTIKDLVGTMTQRIDGAFPDDPAVEADLRRIIAEASFSQQDWVEAEQQLERAVALLPSLSPPNETKRLEMLRELNLVYDVRGELEKLASNQEKVAQLTEQFFGARDPRTLKAHYDLAGALTGASRLAEAWEQAQRTLALRQQVLGPENLETLESGAQVGWLMLARGDLPGAEQRNRELWTSCQRALGASHQLTRTVQSQLAAAMITRGDIAGAQAVYGDRPVPDDLGILKRYQGVPHLGAGTEVLVFWETWCPFSQRTVPRLEEVSHRYNGLEVIGLTQTRPPSSDEAVMSFIGAKNLTFPMVKVGSATPAYFGMLGTPWIVIAHDRRIVWENAMNAPEDLLDGMLRGLERARGG